jgi:hypothetical protein
MTEQNSGPFWMVAAAILSIQLAQGRSGEELDLLSAFFTVVADNLALLSGLLPEEEGSPLVGFANRPPSEREAE